MEAIQILGIVVLIIGILLIGVEFYMPGFGIPGISGTIFAIAGIYLAGKNSTERIVFGIITIVIVAVLLVLSIMVFNSKNIKSGKKSTPGRYFQCRHVGKPWPRFNPPCRKFAE